MGLLSALRWSEIGWKKSSVSDVKFKECQVSPSQFSSRSKWQQNLAHWLLWWRIINSWALSKLTRDTPTSWGEIVKHHYCKMYRYPKEEKNTFQSRLAKSKVLGANSKHLLGNKSFTWHFFPKWSHENGSKRKGYYHFKRCQHHLVKAVNVSFTLYKQIRLDGENGASLASEYQDLEVFFHTSQLPHRRVCAVSTRQDSFYGERVHKLRIKLTWNSRWRQKRESVCSHFISETKTSWKKGLKQFLLSC